MTRAQLIGMAKDNMTHVKAGTINQVPDVARVPASPSRGLASRTMRV